MSVQILQNAGTYEILTPREWLVQQPLIIERAGRTCYQSYRGKPITAETAAAFCRRMVDRGHVSVLEHSSLTVRFIDHSRGFCYDDQTEVRTKAGWKLFADCVPDDEFLTFDLETGLIEHQVATGTTCEPWDGEMLYAETSMVDLAVTPNHRMLYFPYDARRSRKWKVEKAEAIYGKRVKFLRGMLPHMHWAEQHPNELWGLLDALGVPAHRDNAEHLAWILGLWITDGSIELPTTSAGGRVTISQTKSWVLAQLHYRLEVCGIPYRRTPAGVRIYGNRFVGLVQHGFVFGTPRKEHSRVPLFVQTWPKCMVAAFLQGIIAGDGSVHKHNGHTVIYTACAAFAGDLQELVLRAGLCATVRADDRRGQKRVVNGETIENKKVGYVVSITTRANEHLFNRRHWRKEHYCSNVYCVTVPNGLLYVRRNGKACWSGNTHELVRHRVGMSYSQESTRYVDYKLERNAIGVVQPPGQERGLGLLFEEGAGEAVRSYATQREHGAPAEDARQLLPIGIASEIVVTGNFTAWRHMFHMRCDKPAHWEIRRTMCALLVECQMLLPGVFDDFIYGGTHKNLPFYVRLLPDKVLARQQRLRDQLTESRRRERAARGETLLEPPITW